MSKVILWDIDRTLLDFDLNEKNSLKSQFKKYNLGECTDEMAAEYSRINISKWQMLERGELTKDEVKVTRFDDFFKKYGITGVNSADFTEDYENGLADTVVFIENAPEILLALKGKYKQYAVTNGAKSVQHKRLAQAGFYDILDGVFISDEVGYEKPDKRFFDYVLDSIEPCRKDEIVIVGDSLTSDMKGGNNAGIITCRYNPKGTENTSGVLIDYEIKSLNEIYSLLEEIK